MEAAGVGAALVVVFALVGGVLTWAAFREAMLETVRTTAMLYAIVIGASVLNPFFAITHIPAALREGLAGLGLGAYGTLFAIVAAYVVLGMFLNGLSVLVVTIPIVFPVTQALGFDPIWFGALAVIVIEMGMITPPVGLNVFVVKGVSGEVSLATVFRGVWPFLVAMIVCLVLIVLFPQIALFIPNTMFG